VKSTSELKKLAYIQALAAAARMAGSHRRTL
jgi:hypothetical protein